MSEIDEYIRAELIIETSRYLGLSRSQQVDVDFSETSSLSQAYKCHLIRDKLWMTKDGSILEISKMSDNHLKAVCKIFVGNCQPNSVRKKMVNNILGEMAERKATGKKIEEPAKPKRRIKI